VVVVVVEELWSCVLLLEALGEFCFQGHFFCPCVCARARALVDETQAERAEIVKVAVLFVIAVRRGGGKGEQKKTTTKGPKKIPFLGMHFFACHNIGFSGMLEIRAVGVK
jgi:hypothetical protein